MTGPRPQYFTTDLRHCVQSIIVRRVMLVLRETVRERSCRRR